jgi:hypothetical protein
MIKELSQFFIGVGGSTLLLTVTWQVAYELQKNSLYYFWMAILLVLFAVGIVRIVKGRYLSGLGLLTGELLAVLLLTLNSSY